MKLFVIHRFKDRKKAKTKLKQLTQKLSLDVQPVFLDSSGGDLWRDKAIVAIGQVEAVVIFNRAFCEESENATWEIEKVKEAGKKIIEIDESGDDQASTEKLQSLYDLKDEFEECFSSDNKHS